MLLIVFFFNLAEDIDWSQFLYSTKGGNVLKAKIQSMGLGFLILPRHKHVKYL